MENTPRSWIDRAADTLRALAARPWSLFLILLALNALARPYAGFVHDARLYGLQVLNQLEQGAFADDLFLRYGSQDQYSVFSRLVTPLAGLLGLAWTFFLLYLLCNALFILAIQRFVETIIKDRVLSTLALFFLMVTPLPYGGLSIFQVHEFFLTPRILANALVLFGLERMLHSRLLSAFGLLILALLMHPLMACCGLLIFFGWLAVERLSWRQLLLGMGIVTAGGLCVLVYQPLGVRFFGYLDDEWRELVRRASPYNFPLEWELRNWVDTLSCFLIVGAAVAWFRREDPRLARFLFVAATVGVAGFTATVFSCWLPYALLFQGQPYRALWLLKLLQAPLGFWLAARLWSTHERYGPLFALIPLAYLGSFGSLSDELLLPLLFFPVFLFGFHTAAKKSLDKRWLWKSVAASLLLGLLCRRFVEVGVLIVHRDELLALLDTLDLVRAALIMLGPVCWLLLSLALLMRWHHLAGFRSWLAPAALALCVVVQAAFFLIPTSNSYQAQHKQYARDYQFVAHYLEQHRGQRPAPPTIYCPLGRIELHWLELRAKSYFDQLQIVGVLFNRQTAVEGQRRALIVQRFEMEHIRKYELFLTDGAKRNFQDLFAVDFQCEAPTQDDLRTVCNDDGVDYVVINQGFPGLYSATNGRVYIYDCQQVRAALRLHPPSEVAAASVNSLISPSSR